MMIYLHKILPLIFSPLILIIILIVWGLIFGSKKIISIGIVVLIICSTPIISQKFIAYLESDHQLKKPSDVKSANAVVVLSGMLRTIKTKNGLSYEWGEGVDRIFAGINLFQLKKAPTLILTRGKMPWSMGLPEGEYLREVAIKYGVPKENILLTENVENTDQEAKAIKKLFLIDNPEIILITSAYHMPRAQKVFKAAAIKVIPFPVDFRHETKKITFMEFIPSAKSLQNTSSFVREMIGRTYYNLKY